MKPELVFGLLPIFQPSVLILHQQSLGLLSSGDENTWTQATFFNFHRHHHQDEMIVSPRPLPTLVRIGGDSGQVWAEAKVFYKY